MKLIYDFKRNFELETRVSFIETTHRFGQPTINLSCQFIQQNPSQSTKKVRNHQKVQTPIRIIFNRDSSTTDGADAQSLRIILQHLITELGFKTLRQKSLQIISRYNHDYIRIISPEVDIKTRPDSADIYDIVWRNPQDNHQELKLEFCSMHKAKGITRDIVIVLNMNDDLMGMPAKREHDPILETLLSHEEDFPYAEERRLFYVAITRARNCTFLIANRKNPSPFILELSSEIRDIYGGNYLK